MLCSWLRLLVCEPAHVTRLPGSASGPWFAGPHSPWSRPLAPLAPRRRAPLRSQASQLLWAESDLSGPVIVGTGLRPSRGGPCKTPQGQPRDIPVPDQEASAHASVYDDAEPTYVSRSRHGPYCLLQDGKHRHSEVGFRRSMAGLRYPLSTLRFAPHGSPRMTRGRCGSLRLHRRGLSPHTSCRSPGAPVHTIIRRPNFSASIRPYADLHVYLVNGRTASRSGHPDCRANNQSGEE